MFDVPAHIGKELSVSPSRQYPPVAVECEYMSGTRWTCAVQSHPELVLGHKMAHVNWYHVYVKNNHITGIYELRREVA